MAAMGLAAELHIDLDVVLSWPYEKFMLWLAYYGVKEDQRKRRRGKGSI